MSKKFTFALLSTFFLSSAAYAASGTVVCPDPQRIMDSVNEIEIGEVKFMSDKLMTGVSFQNSSTLTMKSGGATFVCNYNDGLTYTADLTGSCQYKPGVSKKARLVGEERYTCEGSEACADVECN